MQYLVFHNVIADISVGLLFSKTFDGGGDSASYLLAMKKDFVK